MRHGEILPVSDMGPGTDFAKQEGPGSAAAAGQHGPDARLPHPFLSAFKSCSNTAHKLSIASEWLVRPRQQGQRLQSSCLSGRAVNKKAVHMQQTHIQGVHQAANDGAARMLDAAKLSTFGQQTHYIVLICSNS